MADDEWVKVAMVEDTVVAEFLTSLKDTPLPPPPPPQPSTSVQPAALSFEWRVRQRRSKGVSSSSTVVPTKNEINPTSSTVSPTTPLSWSAGGASGCAAACRGYEVEEEGESSQISAPKITDLERSKVSNRSCEVSTVKKYGKKKTLTQLREEEVMLEREKRQLKRELESMRDNLERERIRNENFKRMKQQVVSFKQISRTMNPIVVSNHGHGLIHHQSSQNGCREGKMETAVGKFELPDLNLPLEENPFGF